MVKRKTRNSDLMEVIDLTKRDEPRDGRVKHTAKK